MQNIKAVIFDIDGTLANTVPLCVQAFRKAVEPLINRPLSDEEIIASFGPDEEGSIKLLAPDDYKKGTSDFFRYYEDLHDMCNQPFDGIKEVLTALKIKGVHLAVATGKGKYTSELSLKRFGLLPCFETIENGSPEGSRKVEAIRQIINLFGVKKEETVYVGDSPNDIKESHQAGIRAVAAAWADSTKKDKLQEEKPDEMFDHVNEFAHWINEHTSV